MATADNTAYTLRASPLPFGTFCIAKRRICWNIRRNCPKPFETHKSLWESRN